MPKKSDETRTEAIGMMEQGLSPSVVSRALQISRSTCYVWWGQRATRFDKPLGRKHKVDLLSKIRCLKWLLSRKFNYPGDQKPLWTRDDVEKTLPLISRQTVVRFLTACNIYPESLRERLSQSVKAHLQRPSITGGPYYLLESLPWVKPDWFPEHEIPFKAPLLWRVSAGRGDLAFGFSEEASSATENAILDAFTLGRRTGVKNARIIETKVIIGDTRRILFAMR
ncbi:MAG TPA: hypothetical protein VF585_03380 [Chthoniobacterales bacterium]|jgi:hypothetical protein